MTELSFEPMRRAMVASQLRTTGVNDPRVIAAMGEVARERFVPAERAALAYADATVPLADGRALNPPMALGRLLTEAQLQGDERALVIAAGTGYAAAVLDRLAGSVTAVEEDAALAAAAREALAGTGVTLGEGPLAVDIHVLASAEGFPMLYVRERGKGRVHYNALGHDEKALKHPSFRRLVIQGLDWVAAS